MVKVEYGLKINNLTVIGKEPEFPKKTRYRYWRVRCSCGRENLMYESGLKFGNYKTCGGCSGIKELKVGNTFDKLTIVGESKKIKGRNYYPCKCECGNPEPKMIRSDYLVSSAPNKGCGKCVEFDIIGEKFGELEVVEFYGRNKRRVAEYLTKCSCGNSKIANRNLLFNGTTTHCGCKTKEKQSKAQSSDLVGEKFGFLDVLARSGSDRTGNAVFTCKCNRCGNTKDIRGRDLKDGQVSCGCLKRNDPEKTARARKAKTDAKHIGVKRGVLTPIKRVKTKSGAEGYLCECECGNTPIFTRESITSGNVKSCGCLFRKLHIEKLKSKCIGKKHNRLTILDVFRDDGDKTKIKAMCDCGNTTEILYSHLMNGHTTSCGCAHSELRGEKHPNWKPELTDEQHKENESRMSGNPRYKKWRKNVLKRDKDTCQYCGESNELHVHHIIPWSISEEKRYDVGNGVVLCAFCHDNFHATFGVPEDGEKALEMFLAL